MTMDSGQSAQEPLPTQPVDSGTPAQDGVDSGTDVSPTERINGLMRVIGKRTTERDEQEARATRAEAELANANQRLAAYEAGREAEVDNLLANEQSADTDDSDEGIYPPEAENPDAFEYWLPSVSRGSADADDEAEQAGAFSTYVDPNAATRASGLRATNMTETERVRQQFERGLDDALRGWGVEVASD